MGIDAKVLPDRFLKRIDKRDRPKGKAGQTFEKAEAKRVFNLELDLHAQFWDYLNRNEFTDVQYSNPRKPTTVKAGTPDFLITRNSKRLAIEFKVWPNKLSPAQEAWFVQARHQNNRVLCCYDYENATQAVRDFFEL